MVNNARMKAELSLLEDTILQMLSASQGSILDDENLINTLAVSKVSATRCCLMYKLCHVSPSAQLPGALARGLEDLHITSLLVQNYYSCCFLLYRLLLLLLPNKDFQPAGRGNLYNLHLLMCNALMLQNKQAAAIVCAQQ